MILNKIINQKKIILKLIKNLKKKRTMEFIRNLKEFGNIFKLEKDIKKNFDGNRDFYYIVKEIENELEKVRDTDDKVPIVVEYIERNF